MSRDVYSGRLKLEGEESLETILAANNLRGVPFVSSFPRSQGAVAQINARGATRSSERIICSRS